MLNVRSVSSKNQIKHNIFVRFSIPEWNTNMVFQIDDGAEINLIPKHSIPQKVKINTDEIVELRGIFDNVSTRKTLGYIYIYL